MKTPLLLSLLLLLFLSGCQNAEKIQFSSTEKEDFRPSYHFAPATGWMNDPNGMIYIDGEYHLFFQHYPDSTIWGPMHWGHAVTKDFKNWEERPIALYPDSLGYIFSGSAVLDATNSSGLGTLEQPPLVAIYTYHAMEKEKSGALDYQYQGIAYSLDKGMSWTKYANNPVLPNQGIKDFRDPKVRKIQDETGQETWLMTLAALDRIQFFRSQNLIDWEFYGEFGENQGAHGGVWECPDLIPMTDPNGETKWVLLVSINPGGPQKGSATQYFIGEFDQGRFSPMDDKIRWLDYGPDNYAGVTWAGLPEHQNRHLFIGWMSNWLYAQQVPTQNWRSAMTIPRELSLVDVGGTLRVKSNPASEMTQLRKKTYTLLGEESALPSEAFEVQATIKNPDSFRLTLENEAAQKVHLSLNSGLVELDRSQSGLTDFQEDFAASFAAPMNWDATSIRVFVDRHSIEVFINEGELVMTSLVFPQTAWKKISGISGLENIQLHDLSH